MKMLLLLTSILVGTGAIIYGHIFLPYKGWKGEKLIVIDSEKTATSIFYKLEKEKIIKDARLALIVYKFMKEPVLRYGKYRFTAPISIKEVIEKLEKGEIVLKKVTIPEGLTMFETARLLASRGISSYNELIAEFNNTSYIKKLDSEAFNLEGYLFPDTYFLNPDQTAAEVANIMVSNFIKKYRLYLSNYVPTGKLRNTVTLASIIEKEAYLDEEKPIIASVYLNRLNEGIKLYADPTQIYWLKLTNRWEGVLTRKHLKINSPYNTYTNFGLPPSPICSPGLESLLATAKPADTPYLYFVSKNDGSHDFSVTLKEHNRKVAKYRQKREMRLK